MSSNYIASNKNSGADAVRQYEDLLELLVARDSLRGFSIITFQDAAEFSLASNSAFALWHKVFIKHGIVPTNTAMRSLLVIVFKPHAKDVVELSPTEANEVIQTFAFCSSNEALTKCVRHRSTWRDFYWSHVSLFPKQVEGMRILSIAIPDQKPGVDPFVLHPHRRVARLLHDPIPLGE